MSDQARSVIQLSIGTMFALSAMGKLVAPRAFIEGVRDYEILPRSLVAIFALVVIILETILSVSHLSGWLLVVTVPLGLALLCCFFVAVSVNLVRRRTLPCYCFGGSGGESISRRSLARVGVAIVAELVLLRRSEVVVNAPGTVVAGLAAQDLILTTCWVICAMLAVAWVLSVPDLITLGRRRSHGLHEGSDS